MQYRPENPLVVQSDRTLLLETMGPHFAAARDLLARFAELVKSPEYVHTYRLSPLSLWNAASSGLDVEGVVAALHQWSKYPVPPDVPVWIRDIMGRYGRLVLTREGDQLRLTADDAVRMAEVRSHRRVRPLLGVALDPTTSTVKVGDRGALKQALVQAGHPVRDLAGFLDGDALDIALDGEGDGWELRRYQRGAVEAFLAGPSGEGGSGVVVLPCGAGKTIVGIAAMASLGMKTLILCTNTTALRQWRAEILARTTLDPDEVGEYSGHAKEIAPVTLSTYQMLTWRRSKDADFEHFDLFDQQKWGLVIYDEVHLLPAPVFRTVAWLQALRRLGLTATLVREDGHEGDVFALIGPKRYDVPWRELESQGWIATARCAELRVPMPADLRLDYATAEDRARFRIAATNPEKLAVVRDLVGRHPGARTLVIGVYLDQLHEVAADLGAPVLTGETRQADRDAMYAAFRDGETPVLVISRVGNFSVDLPDAAVAIQISGTWGSRQEEAQRLGRVLRPKADGGDAYFYTLISQDTVEQDFGAKRQLFLAEQGYQYTIEAWEPG
jgi:DNA excision repair protein ERCC-3